MGDIFELDDYRRELDIYELDREGLLDYLEQIQSRIEELDEEEPMDMDSEAYEDWGDRHEKLEDLVDEIHERLEELGE